jgi:hypothetical protein
MSERRNNRSRRAPGSKAGEGFQERLLGMLEWLADKDPVRAAKLVGQYLDELSEEMARPAKPVKG